MIVGQQLDSNRLPDVDLLSFTTLCILHGISYFRHSGEGMEGVKWRIMAGCSQASAKYPQLILLRMNVLTMFRFTRSQFDSMIPPVCLSMDDEVAV